MFPVTSLGGYLYYAIFVDDFSRKTWIYFLKKDKVFKWFPSFKALVENQTGKKIKSSRTDNGTEYESNEFNDYCREAGIKRETIAAYTPEQNAIVGRKKPNRYQGYLADMSTIFQSEPCMFEDAVKHQVWKDAMIEEYKLLTKNDVWDVVPRPKDNSLVTSKWLYKIKHGADGSAQKFKARFVA